MNANIYTNQLSNLTIVQDGEVIDAPGAPGIIEQLIGRAQLQVEMAAYDLIHRTNYRRIRNDLVREKRNRAFEAKLGLSR